MKCTEYNPETSECWFHFLHNLGHQLWPVEEAFQQTGQSVVHGSLYAENNNFHWSLQRAINKIVCLSDSGEKTCNDEKSIIMWAYVMSVYFFVWPQGFS